MKIQTKQQAIACLENNMTEIRALQMNAKGEALLENSEQLGGLWEITNDLARSERIEAMKMQDLRTAIREAEALLELCHGGYIEKTRYVVPVLGSDRFFEVDEFYGANEGLVIAELELESADERFHAPAWLGEEVTGDKRYYNSYLTLHPFKEW